MVLVAYTARRWEKLIPEMLHQFGDLGFLLPGTRPLPHGPLCTLSVCPVLLGISSVLPIGSLQFLISKAASDGVDSAHTCNPLGNGFNTRRT